MNPALGPFAIASVLLVLGGVFKAARPHDTTVALEAMGVSASDGVVRVGAVVEAMLAIAALVAVDVLLATLVAVSYATFAGFVALALARRLPISSCGCFGRVDTPPTGVHVGIAVGACVAAVAMAFDPSVSPLDVVTGHLPESVAYVLLVAAGVLLSFALLTTVARSRAMRVSSSQAG